MTSDNFNARFSEKKKKRLTTFLRTKIGRGVKEALFIFLLLATTQNIGIRSYKQYINLISFIDNTYSLICYPIRKTYIQDCAQLDAKIEF